MMRVSLDAYVQAYERAIELWQPNEQLPFFASPPRSVCDGFSKDEDILVIRAWEAYRVLTAMRVQQVFVDTRIGFEWCNEFHSNSKSHLSSATEMLAYNLFASRYIDEALDRSSLHDNGRHDSSLSHAVIYNIVWKVWHHYNSEAGDINDFPLTEAIRYTIAHHDVVSRSPNSTNRTWNVLDPKNDLDVISVQETIGNHSHSKFSKFLDAIKAEYVFRKAKFDFRNFSSLRATLAKHQAKYRTVGIFDRQDRLRARFNLARTHKAETTVGMELFRSFSESLHGIAAARMHQMRDDEDSKLSPVLWWVRHEIDRDLPDDFAQSANAMLSVAASNPASKDAVVNGDKHFDHIRRYNVFNALDSVGCISQLETFIASDDDSRAAVIRRSENARRSADRARQARSSILLAAERNLSRYDLKPGKESFA